MAWRISSGETLPARYMLIYISYISHIYVYACSVGPQSMPAGEPKHVEPPCELEVLEGGEGWRGGVGGGGLLERGLLEGVLHV